MRSWLSLLVLSASCSSPVKSADAGIDAGAAVVTIAAAGDISPNAFADQQQTSDLLVDGGYDAVLVLGDNQYPSGEIAEYKKYFQPTWGRVKDKIFPVPGNHEYLLGTAAGYFSYFGARAGDSAKGYYSFELGQWHVIALNSNDGSCLAVPCGPTSEQVTWLKEDLAANKKKCTLAFWHHPRFNSGSRHGNNHEMSAFWDALYAGGADVVLNGHEHLYERFDPQAPDAGADPTGGIREFLVGTGGVGFYAFAAPQPNSALREAATFGVLKLTLKPDSYDWEFVSVQPSMFTDTGSGSCH
jgi:acid phosphatase type 7